MLQQEGGYGRAPRDGDQGWGNQPADGGLLAFRGDSLLENPAVLGGSAACLVFVAVFAAFSLGSVPPLNYGISYNLWNKVADINTVYTPGRHLIGPWNTFLYFPSSVQTIEFSNEYKMASSGARYPALHSRTKEGLALHLQVSLQYQLQQKDVGRLYHEFNMNYEMVFVSTIRDTLIKAASDYEAFQLWEERAEVGTRMQDMVSEALGTTYANCWGLQLMVINLPDVYEKSIVRTQVQKQQVVTRQFEQDATRVRSVTGVIAAEFDKKVAVIKAKGVANQTLVVKKAQAHARSNTLDMESRVAQSIREKLGLDGADLVTYQRYLAVQNMVNASLFYGFDNADVLLKAPKRETSASEDTNVSDQHDSAGALNERLAAAKRRLRRDHSGDDL